MRPLLLLACLILGPLASAENEKLPELKLKTGKTFTAVTITKKTADGIAIMHEAGTARIPFEQLPDDLVKTLGGFDPAKAAEARKATAQGEAAHYSEMEAAEKAETANPKKSESAAPAAKGKAAMLKVMQASGDGNALCYVLWVQGSGAGMFVYGAFDDLCYVQGIGDVVDDQIVTAALIPAANHTYTTTLGAKSTVKGWTISGKTGDGRGIRHEGGALRTPVSGMRRLGGG